MGRHEQQATTSYQASTSERIRSHMTSDKDADAWDRGKEEARELRELLNEFMAGTLEDRRSGERQRIAAERDRSDRM
jgi:dsDNA-binding SOS-regulon protein